MPTVKRIGPYRFYFYSNENDEPPHIHVDRDALSAKFWLSPVAFASNKGFSSRELREIEGHTQENREEFLEAWYGHFGSSG